MKNKFGWASISVGLGTFFIFFVTFCISSVFLFSTGDAKSPIMLLAGLSYFFTCFLAILGVGVAVAGVLTDSNPTPSWVGGVVNTLYLICMGFLIFLAIAK